MQCCKQQGGPNLWSRQQSWCPEKAFPAHGCLTFSKNLAHPALHRAGRMVGDPGGSWHFGPTALLYLSRWTAMYGGLFSSPSVGWLWVVASLRVGPDVPDGVPSHPHWVAAVSSAAEMTPHPQLHQSFHRQSESHCKMWLQMCLMLWLQAGMARSAWGLADCAWLGLGRGKQIRRGTVGVGRVGVRGHGSHPHTETGEGTAARGPRP